jgi:hypothetical protein
MKTEKNTGTIAFRFRQVLLYFLPSLDQNLKRKGQKLSYDINGAYFYWF